MIGCKECDFRCAEFVRNAQGQQRSGYHLLEYHWQAAHGQRPRNKGIFRGNRERAATTDDLCGSCEGAGCEGCEPDGVVERWNFNTLQRLEDPDAVQRPLPPGG